MLYASLITLLQVFKSAFRVAINVLSKSKIIVENRLVKWLKILLLSIILRRNIRIYSVLLYFRTKIYSIFTAKKNKNRFLFFISVLI